MVFLADDTLVRMADAKWATWGGAQRQCGRLAGMGYRHNQQLTRSCPSRLGVHRPANMPLPSPPLPRPPPLAGSSLPVSWWRATV